MRYEEKHKFKYCVSDFVFTLIRRLFWSDFNTNEDFYCMQCGKPVYRRLLFCSVDCSNGFEKEIMGEEWER